jgi:arylsulfatase A-like enzyme
LCCPSRATIFRGQYAHNTDVETNAGANGGYTRFLARQLETATVATALQQAGYRTALVGKYLNGYPRLDDFNHVAPGWSDWYVTLGGSYVDYRQNENGAIVLPTAGQYRTDVEVGEADQIVRAAHAAGAPFFLELAVYAPHAPATPAPRDVGTLSGLVRALPPSFDEADVSDKPAWVQALPLFDSYQLGVMQATWESRLEALQAVDVGVASLLATLAELGELDNTYVVFTSDNGYTIGEHRRLPGKQSAYEEDIHQPLVILGPGIAPGSSSSVLAGNVDLEPTFLELGQAAPIGWEDGRSLVPALDGAIPASWRTAMLLEHEPTTDCDGDVGCAIPSYRGLRTATQTYVAYAGTGEHELYDLTADPYELQNGYTPAAAAALDVQLQAFEGCEGDACRLVDRGAPAVVVGTASVNEGAAGTTTSLQVPIALTVVQAQPVTVQWATSQGTATPGVDYVPAAGTVTFPPGVTKQTVAITVLGDDLPEPSESIVVALSGSPGLPLGNPTHVWITDDDTPPSITIQDATVVEGAGPARFVVALTAVYEHDVSVQWATLAGGTATPGAQYTVSSGTLTFPAGTTVGQIAVPVIDDNINQDPQTFYVGLSSPVNATLQKTMATATIIDSDPLPTLTIGDATVAESAGVAVFTIALSPVSGRTVTVPWATLTAGTAVASLDYVASSGTVTFAPGTTTATASVRIVNDSRTEPNRVFFVRLGTPTNAKISHGTGIGTIVE